MKKMCVGGEQGSKSTVNSSYMYRYSLSLPHYAFLYLRPALPEGQAAALENVSAVHPAFSHPDVPAFTIGECVLSLELPTNTTTIDIIPQPQSPSSPLSLKPQHTHLHIKRSSASWNFKGHQSNHDNMTKCKFYCLKGNQRKYQRPPLL